MTLAHPVPWLVAAVLLAPTIGHAETSPPAASPAPPGATTPPEATAASESAAPPESAAPVASTDPGEAAAIPEATAPPDADAPSPGERAEPPPPPPNRFFHDIGHDFLHWPSLENGLILAGGGGLALAVKSNDAELTEDLSDSDFLRAAAKPGNVIGNSLFEAGIGVGFYALGHAKDNSKMAHVGWDLLRAQIQAVTFTQGIKYSVQRERPDRSNDKSFPSGHASSTFATAAVLHQHFGWKAGVPGYLIGTYVALSRLSSNKHYLSDVIFGSALGIAAGRTVTYHERHLPPKISVSPFAVPGGGGAVVSLRLGH